MDTKFKRSKAFRVWLCFFIGINLISFFVTFGVSLSLEGNFDINNLGSDFKETQRFKNELGNRFDFLAKYITYDWAEVDESPAIDKSPVGGGETVEEDVDDNYNQSEEEIIKRFRENINYNLERLNGEGENLIYYARNPQTGVMLTNIDKDSEIFQNEAISLPEGYNFYIFYNGDKFSAQKDGKPLDIYKVDNGYKSTLFKDYMRDSPINQNDKRNLMLAAQESYLDFNDIQGHQILLVVKKELVRIPYEYSALYSEAAYTKSEKYILLGLSILFIIGIALFIFSIIKRKYKQEFEKRIGEFLGKVILEFKILGSLILLFLVAGPVSKFNLLDIFIALIFSLGGVWWLYLLWIDARINGRNFLSNNIINRMLKWYREFEGKRPFQKALLLRLYGIVTAEAVLAFLTILFLLIGGTGGSGIFSFVALVLFGLGIYLFYRYLKGYTSIVNDIGKVIDQTESIRQGDMETKLQLAPGADLYMLEDNLNAIQDSIARTVENSIKSERMKIELITNVSHDLKTPLTSIISYVDLLSKEEDLPEHIKDYIGILAQKSERLKLLIQDLFDLSKVVSGEMEFEKKTIDIGKLIEQTLGDLEDKVNESQLMLRVNTPDNPVAIISDGNKLYRVFLNLFQNTLKYSLEGTRVYVDLITDEMKAIVTIKNTANYEMNFSEDEIIERFVRGDKARTSEGSGLGLAIAQNFTLACGGDFDIKVDGDLFKVILSFDIVSDKDIESV
ncbi:MAG TPA: histidine kinase dimerization/phospho-acceptor domain-containing protein [Clostridia bacterium]|nr:histidine kinase dimerization/phospho-acceptor domain-containing protein [Clostridia bacterium]